MKNLLLRLCLAVQLLVLAASCAHAPGSPQASTATIQYPRLADEISNQQVNTFAEDAQGHIWIGTFRGLNKYDAYEYQQYYCTDDSLGPQDNQIKALLRDSHGRLWVSSVNGLSYYTDHDTFHHIPSDLKNKNGVQLIEMRDGRILVNTITSLGVYNPQSGRLEYAIRQLTVPGVYTARCYADAGNRLWVADPLSIRCYDTDSFRLTDSIAVADYPTHYYLHPDSTLWLSGNRRLRVFDLRTRTFRPVPDAIARHPVLSRAEITLIHAYGPHGLLLDTDYDGLFYYDSRTEAVSHQDEKGFPFEAPRFDISTFFTDSRNNLWIGSTDQGYAVAYHYKERFNRDNYLRALLQHKSVISVAADSNNALWIATRSDGLYGYNLRQQKMERHDIRANQVMVDREGYLWLTAVNNRVLKCRPGQGRLEIVASYDVYLPMSLAQDKRGNILVGTATPYVLVLRPGGKNFERVQVFGDGFTFIPGLLPLDDGRVLVAAFDQPLRLLDPATGQTEPLPVHEGDMERCIRRSMFIPTALCHSAQGDIWIGTVSNGLLRYTPSTRRLEPLEGVSCSDISSIEEDAKGYLWIGTQHGLSKLDPKQGRFTNYFADDGIGGNQFYDRASCHLPDGTLALGGTHGLTFFDPLAATPKRNVPLLFENLKVHNQLMRPGPDDACISRHLSYQPDIRLAHDQNGFSISFAALDYNEFERVQYQYRLEGFDSYWVEARHNREAYYANLPDGCYTFRVRATGNDPGSIEAESAIRVIVRPAPWDTWWAWLLYLLAATTVAGEGAGAARQPHEHELLCQRVARVPHAAHHDCRPRPPAVRQSRHHGREQEPAAHRLAQRRPHVATGEPDDGLQQAGKRRLETESMPGGHHRRAAPHDGHLQRQRPGQGHQPDDLRAGRQLHPLAGRGQGGENLCQPDGQRPEVHSRRGQHPRQLRCRDARRSRPPLPPDSRRQRHAVGQGRRVQHRAGHPSRPARKNL